MDVIDKFYETLNIYNSIVVYSNSSSYIIDTFIDDMALKDYPIAHYQKNLYIDFQESNYRMLVLHVSSFQEYLVFKNHTLNNISIIICIDNESYKTTKQNMMAFTSDNDIIVFKT